MDRKPVGRVKAENGVNPLWVIAIAMAVFFAAVTAVIAFGQ